MKERKRSVFYDDGFEFKLMCKCGENLITQEGITDENTGYFRPVCPHCQNNDFIEIKTGCYTRILNEHLFFKEEKITLSLLFSRYFYHNKNQMIIHNLERIRLTFNPKTGYTYLIQNGKKLWNITFGNFTTCQELMNDLISNSKKEIRAFLKVCYKARNIQYRKPLYSRQLTESSFVDMLILLRYPQLQNFPCEQIGWIPKLYRKALDQAFTQKEIFKVFFGTNLKVLQKIEPTVSNFFSMYLYSKAFQSTSNIEKLLISKVCFYPEEKKLFSRRTWKSNREEIVSMFRYWSNLLGETRFVNLLIKEYSLQDSQYRKQKKGRERFISTFTVFESLINSKFMYEELIEEVPDYKVKANKGVRELHDNIMFDYNMYILVPNEPIVYLEKENVYQRTVEKYVFELPRDTLMLSTIGKQMSICVGSYHDRVLEKLSTIVFAYYNKKPVLCMEVTPDKELIQAKTFCNELPDRTIVSVIKKWAKESGVKVKNCYDLQ